MKTKLLFTAIFFSFSALILAQAPSVGLVGYYPFSGTANDFSGNANDPTYIGTGVTLTFDRFGNANSAYYFDGIIDSYIRIPADNFPTTDRTVSLWFNVPEVTNMPSMLSYGGDGNCGTTFFMGIDIAGINQYTVQGHCHYNELDYAYPVSPVNEWYNWVVTVSGATQKIYIDGQFKAAAETFTGSTYVEGRDLSFGVLTYINGKAPYTDANCNYLRGVLDDIRIYDHALSDIEIRSLYEDLTTGIINDQSSQCPKLLNNPSGGLFTVDLGSSCGIAEITVRDLFGRTVYANSRVTDRQITFKLDEPAGIYLMNVVSENTRASLKLIKN